MIRVLVFMVLVLIVLPGCDYSKKERALEIKESALNQKEHDLLLMEKALELKEEQLTRRERMMDSTNVIAMDSLPIIHPMVPGIWNVTMRCIETTCAGSAVGDTRKEQWEISFEKNIVIAKTISDQQLVRVYSGSYVGNTFELNAKQDNVDPQDATRIVVRMQKTKEGQMTGQREIIRPGECRIIYALDLSKQQ